MPYEPQKIEQKWQKFWEKKGFYKAEDFSLPASVTPKALQAGKKPKKYILVEFPYPSGEGLHVGHVRSYAALDAVSRQKRMAGFNVLFPIGFDAFGLPTENFAIKHGIHPSMATKKNIANFRRQLKSLGLSFDWSREINTTDQKYYKWTQWIFLKLFENDLAYQAEMPVNWCPSCKIGLANEEVIAGKCERCGTIVEKKNLKQWVIRITKYADRLIDDLKGVDYPERIKSQQINWIGRSEGASIKFLICNSQFSIEVFTTRPDTIFGVTALVVAPEHPIVASLLKSPAFAKASAGRQILNIEEVENYIKDSEKKSEFERTELNKEKTGVELKGVFAINPVNNEKVPIWIADYVISTYGGGAVMMVPAHDQRDFEFAKKYNLPIKMVVCPNYPKPACPVLDKAYEGEGYLVDSDEFNGIKSDEAKEKIIKWLSGHGVGRKMVHYKLRDWVFSRQHYWGEPIPIIHCSKCGVVPVPEKDLPVGLPYVEKYQPTGTGESPLAAISDWVNVKCPKCKGPAKRETDTMPNWAGSNWYYLRYLDPGNGKALADSQKIEYWMPVDWYNGGMDHTTLHLLYSRFIYKFLWDIGAVPKSAGPEPYQKRTSHGMVLAQDGRKMSKSFGNVVNPDEIVSKYGADALRLHEMFMGPFDQAIAWNDNGVKGVFRFLEKVWNFVQEESLPAGRQESGPEILKAIHELNQKINEDLEAIKFNTIVSSLMEFMNLASEGKEMVGKETIERFLILLSPFAPHISEELWNRLGHKSSVFLEKWPKPEPEFLKENKIILLIQINGKIRDQVEVAAGISEKEAKELTLAREKIKNWLSDKEVKKTIFVPGKLINLVV